jgi:hypothetical protein
MSDMADMTEGAKMVEAAPENGPRLPADPPGLAERVSVRGRKEISRAPPESPSTDEDGAGESMRRGGEGMPAELVVDAAAECAPPPPLRTDGAVVVMTGTRG